MRRTFRDTGSLDVVVAQSFKEATTQFCITNESNWKVPEVWAKSLKRHAKPRDHLKVDAITQDHVLAVVKPIWDSKPATAQQLLNRIDRILSFTVAKRWRTGNPADWRVLKYLLSKPRKLTQGHRPALPYEEVPGFVATRAVAMRPCS